MSFQEAVNSTKFAAGTIIACLGSSIAGILEWIPEDIAKLGILVTIVFTTILSVKHLRLMRLEERKIEAEIRALNRDANKRTRLEVVEEILGSKE